MRILTQCVAVAAVIAASQLCIPAANAQNPSPAATVPKQSSVLNLSDKKLDEEAAALNQVASMVRDYQQRVQAAQPEDRARIIDEGRSAIKKTVENNGLTVKEYDSIIVVAHKDPAVLNKILRRLHPPTEERL